ncbi:MAG: bifunctional aconitate hydratase 2/2-methylisocitrate dehydratase [Candidatus Aminicenantes bacterium RBG_16_63_16]|nr:MAG: bifunctional aconitate hydratase 2/2-methylisocitrate dehydratase [Candidatus Aminicenantes bacterium RBG_16_63_16]
MLGSFFKQEAERKKLGIPPLPLSPDETAEVCRLLENPPAGQAELLVDLLKNRVSPGVDPAAKVKAEWLDQVAHGRASSPIVSKKDAVFLLGTMLGGYNVDPLVEFLDIEALAADAAEALKHITLVYSAFDKIVEKSHWDKYAKDVLTSWAEGEWFLNRPGLADQLTLKVFKVDGEINTDDFSPAKQASTRPDIPLHALSMGETRFPGGQDVIRKFRKEGYRVAFVGDVVGTGSSRKSACNSLMWHIGEDIPFIPNKRRAGVVIGGLIAPIFFNTTEDSGGLPLTADVAKLKTGDVITLDIGTGEIRNDRGEVVARFEFKPPTLRDEFRAGGRLNLIIGRNLTNKARRALGMGEATFFIAPRNPAPKPGQGYSQAQKIVGKACGLAGILPGTACEPKMTTVGSQDTTGPMTADELKELACLEFQADFFMQSFCHTAAYPKAADVKMHQALPKFMVARQGVALKPGDGIIHSWLNRFLLPDTMGTGGDSHTRFPMGLSFPAGSGLVAFAGALGFMPLDMPESVLVKFKGTLNPGVTLRDVVNAIPYFAIKAGFLTVAKKGKKNIFNGRILEMEGIAGLTVDQAYELTDASAERSAAGSVIALELAQAAKYLKSNIALMNRMIAEGYQDADTLKRRIENCEKWLAAPALLERDKSAVYAAVLDIDLSEIKEPILACPNDPDDVKLLSEVAGDKIDEVFIGSCMTNVGHFRATGKLLEGAGYLATKIWLTPPTKMDQAQLMKEGYYAIYNSVGARVEIPGCSLCMGNQARVRPKATVISTSTRNFDDRMGDGARVYLGSAELAAMAGIKGALPTAAEYFAAFNEKLLPNLDKIYKYLYFDEMGEFTLHYTGAHF